VTEAGAFQALSPARVLDTRTGNGATGPVGAGGSVAVQLTGRGGIPSSGVSAVAINLTATAPTAAGYLTAFPDGTTRPTASTLNYARSQTIANMVTIPVGSNGAIRLYNGSAGTVHYVGDIAGYYLSGNPTSDASRMGAWGAVQPWPEVSVHAALTYTGKVLTFQGDFSSGGQQYLLDPATGTTTQVPNAAADLFCAGQAVLSDGRILVVGGTSTSGGLGTTTITAFNPATETWQTLAPMHHPRWYPTATTLADGRVLVTSGANTSSTDLVQVPEVYDPNTNTWTDLTTATRSIPYYPFMYQLPNGRVMQAGASEQATSTIALDVASQQWATIDGRTVDGASITNYAPGKFLKAGSASDSGFTGSSAATAFTLDLNQANATWQPTASMAYPRSFVNLTNLPDGTVLATGGATDKSGYNEGNAVLPAEVWDPAAGTWHTVAAMSVARLYHSVALLLPDGRVFVSGSGGDPGVPDEQNYQIFSPSYLFKGARPTITSAPSAVQYSKTIAVQTPDAASIASVSLIRTGSVTHSFDQNTRAQTLTFARTAGGLTVQMPANGNLAPPGYYMLFIVNGNGVPSVSAMVRLTSAP
jgi:N-acetylneuraminic acid mutarotase